MVTTGSVHGAFEPFEAWGRTWGGSLVLEAPPGPTITPSDMTFVLRP